MKYISFALFLSAFQTCVYSQTCVVGKVYDGSIFVGADSRQTRLVSNGNKIDSIQISTCKIHNVGKFCFVNIGRYPDIAYKIAYKVCTENVRFEPAVLSFTKLFREESLSILNQNRINYPLLYREALEDTILSQICFFGVEDDSLCFGLIIFKAKGYADGHTTVYSQIIPTMGGLIAGETKEIETLFFSDETWKDGAIKGIDKLIGISAKANKKTVALPIDIIKVNKSGIYWIRRKDTCKN